EVYPADSLWKMIQASFLVLNNTGPNKTEHCWLCYDIKPLFYEAMGVNETYQQSNNTDPRCSWIPDKEGITIQQIKGRGKCLG
ncbi:ENV2 protein, partial [Eubucco bourcierii]|nr:ENV2 protein [Eubucco bourcierii]